MITTEGKDIAVVENIYSAVWTATSIMNECMGILVKKISLSTQIIDQELDNISKKKNLHHHKQCLGLET